MGRSLWLLMVWSCSSPHEPAFTATAGDIAITDVTVVPMTTAGELAHQTVVVRGDRIVAIAPHVALPAGVTTIDGAGKWLMPGLADMHVHTWSEDDLTLFVAAGVTTIRNMWGVPEHVTWRSQIERGERLGPTIVTAGALIDGKPPDWPGSIVLTDPAAADALVASQKAAGYDFMKSVNRLDAASYRALAAATAKHGMVLVGHTPYSVGIDGAFAAHQRSIEHLDGYPAALVPPGITLPSVDDPTWVHALLAKLDLARLPDVVARTTASGAWNCPTLIIYDRDPSMHTAAEMQRHVQWLGEISAARRADWIHQFTSAKVTADDAATTRVWNALLAKIAAALAAADAPILVGTDTGGSFVVPGEALHDEIELLVAAGIPRPRVIRAATADAWRFFGRPHEAGVIEVGARADLLVVPTDPLAAPLPLIPDGVIIRGRWLPHAELVRKLADVVAHDKPPASYLPPLDSDGELVRTALYTVKLDGTQVAAERVAIGKHALVGAMFDPGTDVATRYRITADRIAIRATYHTMTLDIVGTLASGELVVTGTDLAGVPVSLRAAGTLVIGPGIGGATALVDQLASMKLGEHRTVDAIELAYYPAIAITPVRYAATRDATGFTVVRDDLTSHFTTDRDGVIATRTDGSPVDTTTSVSD